MKLQNVSRKRVSYVELERDGKTPIGITVKDGTKYGLRPLIKNIKSQSLSHRSHCVVEGDVILSICGEDSKGMGRKDVRRRLKEAGSCIELKLEYEIREACFDNFGIYRYERMSLNIKKESGSFGFILRKNDSADSATIEYPTITNIRPGGPADKEKRLKDGDRLLQIDDQSLSWLSLQEVSSILRNKEKATFLIEYTVGIVDFCIEVGEKTEIEIDCRDTNLGIVLGSSAEDCKVFIQEIQQGSLAQRCGAFHVGDVILRINDIDTALLTVSKANSLLQRFRKDPGKLVFIPYIGGEKLQQRIDTKANEKIEKENKSSNISTRIDHLRVPTIYHSQLETQSEACNERIQPTKITSLSNAPKINPQHQRISNLKHPVFNSPSSLHKTPFVTNNLSQSSQTAFNVHDFQTKTISLFRDIVQNISNMQHFISYFDNEVERITEKDVDTSETQYESQVNKRGITNIDSSRFSQLKAIYNQMKNSAYTFSMHLVRNFKIFPSHIGERNSSPISSDINNVNKDGVTTTNIIHHIMGDLTEINFKQFIAKGYVDELVARLGNVELDCWECRKSCLSASFLTQKILLLLSFNEPDANMRYVIHMLTESLAKLKIPCDDCKIPWCSVSQTGEQTQVFQNISTEPNSYVNSLSSTSKNMPDSKTINAENPLTSNCSIEACQRSIGLNLRTEDAFCNLGHTPSDIGSKSVPEVDSNNDVFQELNDPVRLFARNPGAPRSRIQADANRDWANHSKSVQSKIHRDKDLVQIPMQTWKSNEVISNSRFKFETPNLIKTKSVGSNHFNFSEEKGQMPPILTRGRTAGESSPASESQNDIADDASLASEHTIQTASSISANDERIQTTTTVVKLVNDGSGFGLNFEFNTLSDGRPMNPVITAVHPQSAAHKCGILLKGDRVLEINGQNLVGLSGAKIEAVMKGAFAAAEVLLKVEFDVAVPEIKYGTFDVRIDKDIKPGLEFKEFRKAAPLVVKGVVKGSAAHRSGLLFPGDEILFTNCIRQESYESCTCMYKRTELVIFTVRRKPNKDPQEEELETDIEYESIPSGSKSSISKNFILYRTLFRTVNGNDARVLDHELTLFRDPVHKDFGFLVGQNPDSGKVYVTGIKPGGPADKSEVMKKNDRILEVNGTIIGRHNKNTVLSIFMQDNDRIDLITRRILRCPE